MQKLYNYLNSSSLDGGRALPPRDYPCDERSKISFFDHRKNFTTAQRLYDEAALTYKELMTRVKVTNDECYIPGGTQKSDVELALKFIAKNLYQAQSWDDRAAALLKTVLDTASKMKITLPEPKLDESKFYKRTIATEIADMKPYQGTQTRSEQINHTVEQMGSDGLALFIVKQFFK